MLSPSALAAALRLMLLGMLLASFVLKPALAFAEEVHELTEHAAAGAHGHAPALHDGAPAPDDGKAGHDDDHWHLTHCCGQQAAVLPRMQFDLPAAATTSPVATLSVAFAPTRLTAPFRPPIAV
ncbi:hypothetical protein MNR01_12800 [Lysobacter sp. S4-A87]|uniref:hypothetical protein n=1 Tax=Lysobacter sp. S4-A87 TaxID=2925843 RepID=UPI001F53A981|nr:hypothetical protein [Lysobacter sp. S4-A87]UNK48623.1 hypothetical protein MNR01_12800 [Lysobacter sp. S4-A87]